MWDTHPLAYLSGRESWWAFLTKKYKIFHKIYAGTHKHLMHKKVHLMSPRIICRKRGLQKGGIMRKGVRMTWMVWLKSSIMMNYCFHCHKYENAWNMRQRLCDHLCAANKQSLCPVQATFPVVWASKPHHGTRIEYFQEWNTRLMLY